MTALGVTDSVPVSIVAIPLTLQLTPGSAVIGPGSSTQFVPEVRDSVGIVIPGASAAYSSDKPGLVTVSGAGLASSVGPLGFADITATLGILSSTSRVLVRSAPIPAVVATTQVGGTLSGLAVASTGAMYVGDIAGGGLSRGGLPSYTFPTGLPIGGQIFGIAFDPTGTRAFVARDSLNRVMVFDVATNQPVDSLDTGSAGDPVGLAVSPDGQTLWVGAASSILVYDAHTLAPLGAIPTGTFTIHFATHPTLPLIYASVADSVLEISLTTHAVTRVLRAQAGVAQQIAVSADGAELFVAAEAGSVQIWDLTTGARIEEKPTGGAWGLAVTPQDLIYVGFPFGGEVSVIDRASMVEITRLQVGGIPRRIVLDPTGATAVVVNQSGWVDFIK